MRGKAIFRIKSEPIEHFLTWLADDGLVGCTCRSRAMCEAPHDNHSTALISDLFQTSCYVPICPELSQFVGTDLINHSAAFSKSQVNFCSVKYYFGRGAKVSGLGLARHLGPRTLSFGCPVLSVEIL